MPDRRLSLDPRRLGLFRSGRRGGLAKRRRIVRANASEGACAPMKAKDRDRATAIQRAQLYYELHPGSPSAVRAPRLFVRSGLWIALLGRTIREGIVGFGPTVEAALRAFDVQYLNALRPPV